MRLSRRQKYFLKQRLTGLAATALSVLSIPLLDGDATFCVFFMPIALYSVFCKSMIYIDDYFMEVKDMEKMTLREFCKRYKDGEFLSKDRATQINAGWYDWFCSDRALAGRLKRIWQILKAIESPFILDRYRVIFKNRCPIEGPLFDAVYFTHVSGDPENEFDFVIEIGDQRRQYKYNIYTARNGFEAEFATNSIKEVQQFINTWNTRLHDPKFYIERKQKLLAQKAESDRLTKLVQESLARLQETEAQL